MAKSKIPTLLTGLLLLLFVTQLIFQASTGIATSIDTNEEPNLPMISGVLAHEMNDSQAQTLAANGMWVEADVEINKPDSNWQNIYNLSKQYNIPLIGKLCHVTMDWKNFTLEDWTETAKTAVKDYSDIVHVWEIWNEPTESNFYYGYFNGSVSSYIEMLKEAYQIIKLTSPNSTVIGFGGLHMYSGDNTTVVDNGLAFAEQVVLQRGLEYCDAISLHAYPWGDNSFAVVQRMFNNSLTNYRNIISNSKPVWITEIGQHSNSSLFNITETDQDAFLYESFNFFSSLEATAYIWYGLNDNKREENG
jgi:hypothetical protein